MKRIKKPNSGFAQKKKKRSGMGNAPAAALESRKPAVAFLDRISAERAAAARR